MSVFVFYIPRCYCDTPLKRGGLTRSIASHICLFFHIPRRYRDTPLKRGGLTQSIASQIKKPWRLPRLFMSKQAGLGFAQDVVWDGVGITGNAGFDDGAEVLLVLLDVVGKGIQQTFGMNGIHDDT